MTESTTRATTADVVAELRLLNENQMELLTAVVGELRLLHEQLDQIGKQLEPMESLAPLIEKFAPLLDNPAVRWAMTRKK